MITKYYDHSKGQFVFRFNEGSQVATGSFSLKMIWSVLKELKQCLKRVQMRMFVNWCYQMFIIFIKEYRISQGLL